MATKKPKHPTGTIALNKKAKHDFHMEEKFEAGLVLAGWEVKSLREGKAQLTDSHVFLKNGEAWLLNVQITPLTSTCTHIIAEPTRMRKLLLHKKEIGKISEGMNQAGHTCVALALYWKKNKVKCEIALAKGKKEYDKRATEKERDWNRQKQRVVRDHVK
jgi:SsrA-binding protein|tara:strand:- start:154 stop:633 length:480 start_codon:yes stop_codon:yes gene_type:complete